MKKDYIVDYCGYILIRLFGPVIRRLPYGFGLFLGRRLGDLLYYFDLKHRAISYANIKTALGARLSPRQISKITKEFHQSLGESFIELFFIPVIDKDYIKKHVSIEGLDYIRHSFESGKGIVMITVHAGGWELCNILLTYLGFPFLLFVRDQRYPRLNGLLNRYRLEKGCKVILREGGMRSLIQALRDNQVVGMVVDQGGREGLQMDFFGKSASMATGAVKLALKYDTAVIIGYCARIKGSGVKLMIEPPFVVRKTGNNEQDIRDNLQAITQKFEKYILKYPADYFWRYKIWKYSKEKNILILGDSRAGHLRQAESLAEIVGEHLQDKGIKTKIDTVEIAFRNKFSRDLLALGSCLGGRYQCQGCLWCLKTFLKAHIYNTLIAIKPDIVISAGSSVAAVNYVISRQNTSQSIAIMRPAFLSTAKFDLVVMPKHDNPPRRKNIVVTQGALNLIDEEYLREESEKLIQVQGPRFKVQGFYIGLLIGGDTKKFHLSKNTILEIIQQIKSVAQELNADILVTTSRRTSPDIEKSVKEELQDFPRCRLLIIANEKNIPEAIGGILGLSQIIITSPESISMISEAASSKKYVLVFKSPGLNKKHQRFLEYFAKNKYIYLVEASDLSKRIEDIWINKPLVHALNDRFLVSEAIKRII